MFVKICRVLAADFNGKRNVEESMGFANDAVAFSQKLSQPEERKV